MYKYIDIITQNSVSLHVSPSPIFLIFMRLYITIYTCVYFFWARRCLRSCVRLPPVCSSDRHLATNSAALAGTCPSQLHLQWCLQPPCWNMGRHAAILQPVKCQRIPMAFDFYAFLHVSGQFFWYFTNHDSSEVAVRSLKIYPDASDGGNPNGSTIW